MAMFSSVSSEPRTTQTVYPARKLERLIGRPASDWRVDDLMGIVRELGVRQVNLMHMGGDGWLKTLDFVPRSESHLRDVLEGGERADGSSLFPGTGIQAGASDILLRPRLDTAFLDPFEGVPALVLLCSHHGRDNQPLPQSPDSILRRAYARAKHEAGVDLWALGEVEYFVGRHWCHGDRYGADDRGYHATAPMTVSQGLRRRALLVLAEMGVPIKYGHSEVGFVKASTPGETVWEQHEIELALAPLPAAAEAVALTHWVLRNLAYELGMDISFEPIIGRGHAGNGLHFHLSPVVDGRHAGGRQTDGQFSDAAKWLIVGLTRLGGALMAFGNREERSFVRLTQAKEAPSSVFWGEFDRRALIRIPIQVTASDGRMVSTPTIEFRLGDGSAHPHLLLAGIAQALIAGKGIADLDAVLAATAVGRAGSDRHQASAVPSTFEEVAEELTRGRAELEAGGVFPTGMIEAILSNLRRSLS